MVVQHNLTAMNSNRMLGVTTSTQSKLTEQLSSGYKINRAADDAAGLTISEKMRSQIRGLTQASANAQDGISCVQTAEGALAEVHDMLQRMNELAVKSANGTNTTADRVAIQKEINALVSEIDRVSQSTQFNTLNLLDGTFAASKNVTLQVGTANKSEQTIAIKISAMSAQGLGIASLKNVSLDSTSTTSLTTQAGARAAISMITAAIAKVSSQRSSLGAVQNRLEHTIANLDNIVENTTAAESAIRDTDMADTMVRYSNNNILAQAGQSMLAQANQSNQGVLSLLG
ncbi:MAG: flagellin [Lachnospiraceae bacterium]|nr:flagellin [Lachnospiraceae bacterium]